MTMPMFPGFVTNQPLSGQGVGQALASFLPCLPGEGPPLMPRVMAKALYPRGFNPFQPIPVAAAAPAPPVTLIPPAAPAPAPAPAVDAKGNQIQRRQPLPVQPAVAAQPAPYRPQAVSQRVQIRERAGV
ncbi:hypothetical protein ES703_124550 [subsurface metagenome]